MSYKKPLSTYGIQKAVVYLLCPTKGFLYHSFVSLQEISYHCCRICQELFCSATKNILSESTGFFQHFFCGQTMQADVGRRQHSNRPKKTCPAAAARINSASPRSNGWAGKTNLTYVTVYGCKLTILPQPRCYPDTPRWCHRHHL